ncbi:FTS and Hook-interacting -like protein [Trichinella nativa]|uniref:FTS and Hook-interacting-like protein n=1 Tax=Trichinella nativa TaxID=6335 RepID=A0A0V1LGG4_9BILA|nr:FTS and Hook-interacting -like protein [Trichinella nativa]
MHWLKSKISMAVSSKSVSAMDYSTDAAARFDVFQSHWNQVHNALLSSYPDEEHQTIVFRHLEYIVTLLVNEANEYEELTIGPIMEYAFNECIFHLVVCWATSCKGILKVSALGQIFKLYEMIISQTTPCVIVHKPMLLPLLSVLEELDGNEDCLLNDVKEPLVFLLHQICTKIAEKEESTMMEFFFSNDPSGSGAPAKFLIFTLLVPFLYYGGHIEQLVRDALLLVLSVSCHLDQAAEFMATETNFCPVLASGLAAVYSSLPRRLHYANQYEDWCRVTNVDLLHSPELMSFRNALEFVNAVVQASHARVVSALVTYIYNGFLLSVLKPALLESNVDDLEAVVAYTELIFRSMAEQPLRNALIRFLLLKSVDSVSILELLVQKMENHAKLIRVCLAFFETVLELNSEKLMFQLIFKYLIPCGHILADQTQHLRNNYMLKCSFDVFLNYVPFRDCQVNIPDGNWSMILHYCLDNSNSTTEETFMEEEETSPGCFFTELKYGLMDYMRSARIRVGRCRLSCKSWKYKYDGTECSKEATTHSDQRQQWSADECLPTACLESARSTGNASSLRSDCQAELLSRNCAYRRSRSKAYLTKKKPASPSTPEKRRHALSALDLAVSGAHTDLEEFSDVLELENNFQSRKLVSFESETFLNLYQSSTVPSSFLQLTYVDGQLSSRSGVEEDVGAVARTFPIDSEVKSSLGNTVDWSLATDLEKFQNLLREVEFQQQPINDIHDAVNYVGYMYDKLLLPWASSSSSTSGQQKQQKPLVEVDQLTKRSEVEDHNCSSWAFQLTDSAIEVDLTEATMLGNSEKPTLGPFLELLFNRLRSMLDNSLFENLLITGVLSRLACYPQPLITSLLLSTWSMFQPSTRSLSQLRRSRCCSRLFRTPAIVLCTVLLHIFDLILSELSTDLQARLGSVEHLATRLQYARDMLSARQNRDSSSSPSDDVSESYSASHQRRVNPVATASNFKEITLSWRRRNRAKYNRLRKAEKESLAHVGFGEAMEPLLYSAVVFEEFCKEVATLALEQDVCGNLPETFC